MWRPRLLNLLAGIGLLAVILDRAAWAAVSQWREDQALSIWLGFHLFERFPATGLLNSIGMPNPNGIALFAAPLSLLPNLFTVSLVLGCLTAASTCLACRAAAPDAGSRWFIALVALSSAQVRAVSVELWGQWLMIPWNLLFIATAVAYWRRPRPLHWVIAAALMITPPALYLAGIVNSVVFAVIWLALALHHRAAGTPALNLRAGIAIGALAAASVALVWLPYFSSVDIREVLSTSIHHGNRLESAVVAMAHFPAGVRSLIRGDLAPIWQSDPAITGRMPDLLMSVSELVLTLELLAAACAVVLIVRRRSGLESLGGVLIAAAIVVLAYPLSPLLGGFRWDEGERLDQSIQLLAPLLIALFGLAAAAPSSVIRRITAAAAVVFAVTNLAAGWIAVASHLTYEGRLLTRADVPLVQKMEATAWVAKDWVGRSNARPIPVAYELVGPWKWLPSHGKTTSKWHPGLLTVGRAYDYELARRYGLRNAFEGMEERPNSAARYVFSYACEPRPPYLRPGSSDHRFGRLRVSVQPD